MDVAPYRDREKKAVYKDYCATLLLEKKKNRERELILYCTMFIECIDACVAQVGRDSTPWSSSLQPL